MGFLALLTPPDDGSIRFVRSRKVLIILFDDVQSLDVTGPMEVFAGTNAYLAAHTPGDADETGYLIRTASVGDRRPQRTTAASLCFATSSAGSALVRLRRIRFATSRHRASPARRRPG